MTNTFKLTTVDFVALLCKLQGPVTNTRHRVPDYSQDWHRLRAAQVLRRNQWQGTTQPTARVEMAISWQTMEAFTWVTIRLVLINRSLIRFVLTKRKLTQKDRLSFSNNETTAYPWMVKECDNLISPGTPKKLERASDRPLLFRMNKFNDYAPRALQGARLSFAVRARIYLCLQVLKTQSKRVSKIPLLKTDDQKQENSWKSSIIPVKRLTKQQEALPTLVRKRRLL